MVTNHVRGEAESVVSSAPDSGWTRAFQDLPREHGFEPLRVEGRLPQDLAGTLYRNGPSLFGRAGKRYAHWFDGDGAISAVRIANGGAQGAVRLVESDGLKQERAAGKLLLGGYGTRSAQGMFKRIGAKPKNAANTSVMMWNGRLFALFEGGFPTELSPEDLHTIGEQNLDGMILNSFSAHPHRVAERKTTYNFGLRFGRQTLLDLYALRDDGTSATLCSIPLPAPTMIHDFIATPRHLIFFVSPLRLRVARMLLGLEAFSGGLQWQPERGTEVIVVPIDDVAHPIRFQAEPFYQWHFANAVERGGEIVVDLVAYPDFTTNQFLGQLPHGPPVVTPASSYWRATIDLAGRRMKREEVWRTSCEFPRINTRHSETSQFTYLAAHSRPPQRGDGLFDVVAKLDVRSGKAETLKLGPNQFPSEPVFVSRPEAKDEDDGHVLTLVYDAVSHTSHVAVLDARSMSAGPVARLHFDHHIPFTFHGGFVPSRAQ